MRTGERGEAEQEEQDQEEQEDEEEELSGEGSKEKAREGHLTRLVLLRWDDTRWCVRAQDTRVWYGVGS